jgi:hypothetical protein
MTVMLIAIPGASEIHGAVSTKVRPSLIIKAQSAAVLHSGCYSRRPTALGPGVTSR